MNRIRVFRESFADGRREYREMKRGVKQAERELVALLKKYGPQDSIVWALVKYQFHKIMLVGFLVAMFFIAVRDAIRAREN